MNKVRPRDLDKNRNKVQKKEEKQKENQEEKRKIMNWKNWNIGPDYYNGWKIEY